MSYEKLQITASLHRIKDMNMKRVKYIKVLRSFFTCNINNSGFYYVFISTLVYTSLAIGTICCSDKSLYEKNNEYYIEKDNKDFDNIKTSLKYINSNSFKLRGYKLTMQTYSTNCFYWYSNIENNHDLYFSRFDSYIEAFLAVRTVLFCDMNKDGSDELICFVSNSKLHANDILIIDTLNNKTTLVLNENGKDIDDRVIYDFDNFPDINHLDWYTSSEYLEGYEDEVLNVLFINTRNNNNFCLIYYRDGRYNVEYHTE